MNNIERFANMMSNRMKQTSNAAIPTTIELGTVNPNLSITPDSLRVAIPKGDYMVNITLTGGRTTSSAGGHNGHTNGAAGEHSHELPTAYRGLQPGDRVLLAWCGNEPVVLAIVKSS